LFVFFIALLLSLNCSHGEPPTKESEPVRVVEGVEQRTVSHLFARMKEKPFIIDVRTEGEYTEGHIPGAKHLPLSLLPGRLQELESHQESPVYLVCARGGRSQKAALILRENGFTKPINVIEGTLGWKKAGYALE
jgi:rhodanese-related sulfurtransferase